jgi:hypothetical protein
MILGPPVILISIYRRQSLTTSAELRRILESVAYPAAGRVVPKPRFARMTIFVKFEYISIFLSKSKIRND